MTGFGCHLFGKLTAEAEPRALRSGSSPRRLLEAVYPEVASSQSDLATLAQILSLESVTPGSRDSLQKAVPVSTSASEADLVQVLPGLKYRILAGTACSDKSPVPCRAGCCGWR